MTLPSYLFRDNNEEEPQNPRVPKKIQLFFIFLQKKVDNWKTLRHNFPTDLIHPTQLENDMNFDNRTSSLLQSIAKDAGVKEELSKEELERCHSVILDNCEGDEEEYYYVAKEFFNN